MKYIFCPEYFFFLAKCPKNLNCLYFYHSCLICLSVLLFTFQWTKRKGKNEIFIFRFSLCASRARESLLDVSQTSNKKEKPQNFQNKKGYGNLKFFLSQSMEPNTALELVKQGVTLLLLDVPQYTLLGIDTQVLLLILYSTSFFCLLLLIFIHQSIDQCGRCFLLGLLLRASR